MWPHTDCGVADYHIAPNKPIALCIVHTNKVVHFYNAHNTECIPHDMVDVANTAFYTHSKLLVKSNHSTIAKACILLGISCSRTVHCAADHPLT